MFIPATLDARTIHNQTAALQFGKPAGSMSPNVQASLYMVLSMAGFSINDALVKSLDGALPSTQVMAVRGLILSGLILLLLWQRGLHVRLREALTPIVGLRAAMELLATLFFLSALSQLTLASISAVLQALPLMVTLGAAVLFGERVGWRRWLAILIGLTGVMMIIRPGTQGFEPASLLVMISVVLAAARDLATRVVPAAIPSLIVTTATAIMVTVFGFVVTFLSGSWVALEWMHIRTLSMASVFLFFGYQFIVMAMRTGEIAYVVPYRYTSLLWSVSLGYLFFAEVPDRWTMVGSAIVISMGLFSLYREVVRSREAKR